MNKLKGLKEALDYFVYEPEKTKVITQIYFLNKVYRGIDSITFIILDFTHKVISKFYV